MTVRLNNTGESAQEQPSSYFIGKFNDRRSKPTESCPISKSVLKRCVQFCLTASLSARVHGKVRSLSNSLTRLNLSANC